MPPAERTERIRHLNDSLRRRTVGGRLMLTAGVAALDIDVLKRVLKAVQTFDAFDQNNDPYGRARLRGHRGRRSHGDVEG